MKNKTSIVDILFVLIFVILLFIPSVKFDRSEVSTKENRTLAKIYPLFIKGEEGEIYFNDDFFFDFDEWFNDRFFGRNFLINLVNNNLLKTSMNAIYYSKEAIVDKKNNFFIYRPQFERSYEKLSNEEILSDFKKLEKLNNFCKKHSIDLYVIIIPQKVNIFKELVPLDISRMTPVGFEYEKAFSKTNFNFIYPHKELINAKALSKDFMYYKQEAHMTDWGMYVVYLAFIEKLKEKYPNFKAYNLDDFDFILSKFISFEYKISNDDIGATNKMSLNCSECLDVDYKHYKLYQNEYHSISGGKLKEEYTKGNPNLPNLFIIGSSYAPKFFKIANLSFNKTYKVEVNDLEGSYERLYDKILQNKTNVLALVFNEGDAHWYFEHMY